MHEDRSHAANCSAEYDAGHAAFRSRHVEDPIGAELLYQPRGRAENTSRSGHAETDDVGFRMLGEALRLSIAQRGAISHDLIAHDRFPRRRVSGNTNRIISSLAGNGLALANLNAESISIAISSFMPASASFCKICSDIRTLR